MRQGYFPIIQPFSAIPEGKIWRAREAKRKSHSFISIRGLYCFSSQACGPYKQWQNTHMHTHTCAHTNIHTHTEKLMPSSHCTILARFFNRRQVMINRQQMHNIGGRSVLVHVRDNRAVWIIKDAIWENRGLHMWNIRHAKNLELSVIHNPAVWMSSVWKILQWTPTVNESARYRVAGSSVSIIFDFVLQSD